MRLSPQTFIDDIGVFGYVGTGAPSQQTMIGALPLTHLLCNRQGAQATTNWSY